MESILRVLAINDDFRAWAEKAWKDATTPVADVAEIVEETCTIECTSHALVYYERVPSVSNPGDAPSRGAAPVALAGIGRAKCVSVEGAGLCAGRLLQGVRDLACKDELGSP